MVYSLPVAGLPWTAVSALESLLSGLLDRHSLCLAAPRRRSPRLAPRTRSIVFDASGSMSGNQTLGIPNSRARIDEVRAALAQVVPNATKFRRVGLITYGPGPYNQCNVKLELKPTPDAGVPIMSAVNALVPAGKTPLTSGHRNRRRRRSTSAPSPASIVVITDGEETCGRSPCDLAKQLHARRLPAHRPRYRLPL